MAFILAFVTSWTLLISESKALGAQTTSCAASLAVAEICVLIAIGDAWPSFTACIRCIRGVAGAWAEAKGLPGAELGREPLLLAGLDIALVMSNSLDATLCDRDGALLLPSEVGGEAVPGAGDEVEEEVEEAAVMDFSVEVSCIIESFQHFCACVRTCTNVRVCTICDMRFHWRGWARMPTMKSACSSLVHRPVAGFRACAASTARLS